MIDRVGAGALLVTYDFFLNFSVAAVCGRHNNNNTSQHNAQTCGGGSPQYLLVRVTRDIGSPPPVGTSLPARGVEL